MNVCIVGTGYVGLVSAACLAEMGNDVICVDVNSEVVSGLRVGEVHIYEPGLEDLVRCNMAQGRLTFTTDIAEGLAQALPVFITVGTPSMPDGSCDLSFIDAVARDIGRVMQGPKVVVNKSTVPVGTAERVHKVIASELNVRGVDFDFDVVSNPEFLKEGDAVGDFMKPDRVIIGTASEHSADLLKTLYSPFARSREKFIHMSVRSAEMTKYAANCMLASKISFINEMAAICERVGADVGEVRLGIGSDPRIGYSFIYPGVGYGGSCFPKDIKALIYTARKSGYEPQVLAAVDAVNQDQKILLAKKISAYFEPHGGLVGKTLALWGLAFKPNTDDIREASALDIIALVTANGMKVRAFDPVASEHVRYERSDTPGLTIVDRQYEALEGADALAIVTEWNQFRNPDFDRMKSLLMAPIVFDGRNLYDPEEMYHMGFAYFSIGRRPISLV